MNIMYSLISYKEFMTPSSLLETSIPQGVDVVRPVRPPVFICPDAQDPAMSAQIQVASGQRLRNGSERRIPLVARKGSKAVAPGAVGLGLQPHHFRRRSQLHPEYDDWECGHGVFHPQRDEVPHRLDCAGKGARSDAHRLPLHDPTKLECGRSLCAALDPNQWSGGNQRTARRLSDSGRAHRGPAAFRSSVV